MLNVGIVTLHCSYNFGSALQTYALQTVVENMGHTATIIDYRSIDYDQYKLLSKHSSVMRNNLEHADMLAKLFKRRNSFRGFANTNFHLSKESYSYEAPKKLNELSDKYDCFVCGSDQIWNLDMTGGPDHAFFLDFAGDKRRIAYAPSLGHTTFLPENFDRAEVAGLLSQFDFLSVREQESLPLFQPLVTKDIKVVLDPTLLLDKKFYSGFAENPVPSKDYLFVYLLRESPELVESACAMATASNSEILYVCDHNLPIPNATNLFGVGPAAFVSLVAHARAVLTNSFHAMIFSIVFNVPFRVFATDATASRIRGLLTKIGAYELCYSKRCDAPIGNIDWQTMEEHLDDLRAESLQYLRRALA